MRGDVYDGTVQLLDFDMKFADGDLELFACLRDGDLLLGHVFHLGQKFVNFSLEFRLLLFRPEKKKYILQSWPTATF